MIVAFEDVDDAHPVGPEGDFILACARRDLEGRIVGAQDGRVRAAIQDHDNKDLFGHDLADKIVCIPQTIGSSSAATLFMIILDKGIAPKAMLFANHIDSLAACGILMGDNWLGKRIVTVDLLGDDFLDAVKTGDKLTVHEDGTIEVG